MWNCGWVKGRGAAQEGVRAGRDVGAARPQPIRGHVQNVNDER